MLFGPIFFVLFDMVRMQEIIVDVPPISGCKGIKIKLSTEIEISPSTSTDSCKKDTSATPPPTSAPVSCPMRWIRKGNNCYLFQRSLMNQLASEASCLVHKAKLVSISNEAENIAIKEMVTPPANSAGKIKFQAPLDISFVVDSRGGMGDINIEGIKNFTTELLDCANIGPDELAPTRISFAFSGNKLIPSVKFNKTFDTLDNAKEAIKGFNPTTKNPRNFGGPLQRIKSNLLDYQKMGIPDNAFKIIIMFTNAHNLFEDAAQTPQLKNATKKILSTLHALENDNVRLFAIGEEFTADLLKKITNSTKTIAEGGRYMVVEDFKSLSDDTKLLNLMCNKINAIAVTEPFIGLTDKGGNWKWEDGSSNFENWDVEQPAEGNCAVMCKDGAFKSAGCEEKKQSVCELNYP